MAIVLFTDHTLNYDKKSLLLKSNLLYNHLFVNQLIYFCYSLIASLIFLLFLMPLTVVWATENTLDNISHLTLKTSYGLFIDD